MSDKFLPLEAFLRYACQYWCLARRTRIEKSAQPRAAKWSHYDEVFERVWKDRDAIEDGKVGYATYFPSRQALVIRVEEFPLTSYDFRHYFGDERALMTTLREFVESDEYAIWREGRRLLFKRESVKDFTGRAVTAGVPSDIVSCKATLIAAYSPRRWSMALQDLTIEEARVVAGWRSRIVPSGRVLQNGVGRHAWINDTDTAVVLPSVLQQHGVALLRALDVEVDPTDHRLNADALGVGAGAHVLIEEFPDELTDDDYLIVTTKSCDDVTRYARALESGFLGTISVLDRDALLDYLSQRPWVWQRYVHPSRAAIVIGPDDTAGCAHACQVDLSAPFVDRVDLKHLPIARIAAIVGVPGSGRSASSYQLLRRLQRPLLVIATTRSDDLRLLARALDATGPFLAVIEEFCEEYRDVLEKLTQFENCTILLTSDPVQQLPRDAQRITTSFAPAEALAAAYAQHYGFSDAAAHRVVRRVKRWDPTLGVLARTLEDPGHCLPQAYAQYWADRFVALEREQPEAAMVLRWLAFLTRLLHSSLLVDGVPQGNILHVHEITEDLLASILGAHEGVTRLQVENLLARLAAASWIALDAEEPVQYRSDGKRLVGPTRSKMREVVIEVRGVAQPVDTSRDIRLPLARLASIPISDATQRALTLWLITHLPAMQVRMRGVLAHQLAHAYRFSSDDELAIRAMDAQRTYAWEATTVENLVRRVLLATDEAVRNEYLPRLLDILPSPSITHLFRIVRDLRRPENVFARDLLRILPQSLASWRSAAAEARAANLNEILATCEKACEDVST